VKARIEAQRLLNDLIFVRNDRRCKKEAACSLLDNAGTLTSGLHIVSYAYRLDISDDAVVVVPPELFESDCV
jgi:hypothetical protein